MTGPLWLVRAMDAIQRILAAGVKVYRARTHRIVRTAFDIIGKRAERALLTLGRRPSQPNKANLEWPLVSPCSIGQASVTAVDDVDDVDGADVTNGSENGRLPPARSLSA